MKIYICLSAMLVCVGLPTAAAAESSPALAFSRALTENAQKQKPQKIAFLTGGSCDANKGNFTNEFAAWNRFLTQKGWQVFPFISADKQSSLAEEFRAMKPFIWDAFLQELASSPLKKGDSLFITFISHGSLENGVHGICDDSQTYNDVSSLKNILAGFAQKGVKIGVFDQSCFGGASVDQLDSRAYCVASSSQYNQEGSGGVTGRLAEKLQPYAKRNISLEDIWVMTLAASLKLFRQIPAISGLGNRNEKLLRFNRPTKVNYFQKIRDNETAVFSGKERQEGLAFIRDNQKRLREFFPEGAIVAAEEFFHQNNFFKVSDEAVVAVNYWLDNPAPGQRICADFVF